MSQEKNAKLPSFFKHTRQEIKDEKNFVDTIMYGLRAPLIVTPGTIDDVTEDMKEKHRLYCIAEAINCVKNEMSTDYDAMLYYSFASLEGMPTRNHAECYEFLFFKYYPNAEKLLQHECPKLDENQLQSIRDLKRWIYKKQIAGIKK